MQNVIKQAKRFNQPLPDGYVDEPVLYLGLDIYLEAFYELSSNRSTGFDIGPIPWTAVCQYSEFYGFEGLQSYALFHHVRALDNVYLEIMRKRIKAEGG